MRRWCMPRMLLPVTALAAASASFAALAVDRWWPCHTSGLDSAVCLARQADTYTGAGTLLGAFESPLLGVAYLLVTLAIIAAGVGAGRPALAGLAALLPGLQGALSFGVLPSSLGVAVVLLVLTVVAGPLGAVSLRGRGLGGGVLLAYGVGIFLVSYLADSQMAVLLNGGYASHDTHPGTWLPAAAGCAVAAVTLVRAGRR